MQFTVIQRIFGLLLMLSSITMLPPAAIGFFYGDGAILPFLLAFSWTLAAGFLFWLPVRSIRLLQDAK